MEGLPAHLLAQPPVQSRAAHPFTHPVAFYSGSSGFSGAAVPGEELFGRGDAGGWKALVEILLQAVPTQVAPFERSYL